MQFAATYAALTAIIAARYLAVSGLFDWLARTRKREDASAGPRRLSDRAPKPGAVAAEIRWSLISAFIYALPGAIVIEAWKAGGTALYTELSLIDIAYIPASMFVYLFAHDTYFYWTHRAMHHPKLFRPMHLVHHQSRPPTAWASFSFHPYEAIVSAWLLPAMTFVIPLHVGAALFILTLMTVAAALNHAGYEVLPDRWLRGPAGRHLITAAHHDIHHRKYGKNFGLYFRWWDKWMGTDVLETEYDFLAQPSAAASPETRAAAE